MRGLKNSKQEERQILQKISFQQESLVSPPIHEEGLNEELLNLSTLFEDNSEENSNLFKSSMI
jgi:hypothetical protein